MRMRYALALLTLPAVLVLTGCGDSTSNGPKAAPAGKGHAAGPDAEVKNALAKLPDDERRLAEAQKFCAVQTDNLLGSMGTPVKVMVKDQPVFLCCKSCTKEATADPDKTLAVVDGLKKKVKEPAGK